MNRNVIVRQNGFKDCGPSCLLSIMKYYGYFEASHEEVSYILKTNIDGTNAYNIINGARSFGFDGYGAHITYENIINKEISFPIICHVLNQGMYHFIVVYDVKKDYLLVMDPSTNNTKLYFDDFKDIYLGTSIVIYPVKKFEKIRSHRTLFNFIFNYLYMENKNIIKITFLSIITILFSVFGNYYTLICIDNILPNYSYNLLFKISVIFMNMFLIKSIIDFYKNKILIKIEKEFSLKLNNDVVNKFFNLPYQFFKNKSTEECITRLNDLKEFKELITNLILNIFTNIILVILSMFILIFINFKIFLISIIELIIYFIIVLIYKNIFNKKTENILVRESEYNKCLSESILGYETNKNLNLLNQIQNIIEIKYTKYLNSNYSYQMSLNKQIFLKDLINNICYILSVYISIIFVHKGIISLGEFILFNSVNYYFKEPLKSIFDLEPHLNYIKNIYNRINDLILIKDCKSDLLVTNIKEDICFDNLAYSNDGFNKLFENVSFKIPFGSKYLIYGNSGNGKSTIIKLLLKYLNDYEGNIYIGNKNLKDISEFNISHNMTYVSQNSYVNNDTLKNNIIYGRNINDNEYEMVLDICNLNIFRDSKKLRNNFIIEDNGFNISGGERQKIILARSLLKKSNYLILDEALSEVGLKEEIDIMNKIFNLYKDKTIIYISHKKEIIDMFNSKYKLERRNRNA